METNEIEILIPGKVPGIKIKTSPSSLRLFIGGPASGRTLDVLPMEREIVVSGACYRMREIWLPVGGGSIHIVGVMVHKGMGDQDAVAEYFALKK